MGSDAGTVTTNVRLLAKLHMAALEKCAAFIEYEKLNGSIPIRFRWFPNVLHMAYLDFARYHIIDERFAKLFEALLAAPFFLRKFDL